MIIKSEVNDKGIHILYVKKEYDDDKMEKRLNTFVKQYHIKNIIHENTDVYTEEGKLLLRFRKNILPKKNIDDFYDNIIGFAKNTTSNRGSTSGSKTKNVGENPKIMTNIFGYFDKWSPSQKLLFRENNFKPMTSVRETRFNMDSPDKYEKTLPLIRDIDRLYKKLTPKNYRAQRSKADMTYFKIQDTSFTTITTNINFQTTIHTDKGDDADGFGNLTVIERGEYSGGETCFPQYGIGVDVRTGDILFMDVHQPHANLKIKKHTKDTIRLSIVCYLRKNIWELTKNKSRDFYEEHCKQLKELRESVAQ